ncbi:MAG: ATP-binding cassette domain-containing protein [Nitrospinae bacterium]|nr:ATP-binding cassette domain-containing protein [Nitrospinota bacterium]
MLAIETWDLRYSYPAKGKSKEVQALKGINLLVSEGEIFGFLGPNGSGKTTLFKILSTLVAPPSGSASIFEHDLRTDADEARKLIGVVFQHPSLDKKLTVTENLRHHGNLYGMDGDSLKKNITRQLEVFGLADRRDEYVETLSGGLRRRVELAKALLTSPKLLILDEPSTGLDPSARRELWDAIVGLKKSAGLTVVVTTHLGDEGDRCDSLVIMNEGRVMSAGSPAKLKSLIGGDVIAIHCDAPEDLSEKIRDKFGAAPSVVAGAVRIELARGHEFIPKVVEAFPGQVRAVTLGKPALEDVFIRLTGKTLGSAELGRADG